MDPRPRSPDPVLVALVSESLRRWREEGTDVAALLDRHPALVALLPAAERAELLASGPAPGVATGARSGDDRAPGTDGSAHDGAPAGDGAPFEGGAEGDDGGGSAGRYAVEEEVGRGAMGVVYRVHDEDLDRELAMKVLLDDPPGPGGAPRTLARRKLARFLEEARVTGQLDHPGIVPVHELGVDDDGRTFFTMRLVHGLDLEAVIDRVHAGDAEWTLIRAVGVLLRVCEAVAFAHARGVLHRDLKPSNVMVGGLGETYVMDWGLAKDLRRGDVHDIRLSGEGGGERDSLTTMDGDVVGTPAYMAPEQARGDVAGTGVGADVYSVGAMLYHLLSGSGPYMDAARVPQRFVLEAVRRGPPPAIEEQAPLAPPELQAICARAMRRKPAERYADLEAMAADLRAYLEGRVVQAYETGAVAELRKWVRRNRALAASIAAGLLVLVGGLVAVSAVQAKRRAAAEESQQREASLRRDAEEAEREERLARAEADEQRDRARELAAESLRYADGVHAQDLAVRANELWPVHADTVPAMDAWLAEAAEVLARAPGTRARLAELRARSLPYTDAERERDLARIRAESWPELQQYRATLGALESLPGILRFTQRDEGADSDAARELEAELEKARADHARLEPIATARFTWSFDDVEDVRTHGKLAEVVAALDDLERHVERVSLRRERAATIAERTLSGPDARARWDRAIAAVAESPLYDGLELRPMHGLLPLGPDPESGLQEFAHLASGEPPVRAPGPNGPGRYAVTEATGVVLVLLPGGPFHMGCSPPGLGPNPDPDCAEGEGPAIEVDLDPFLVAKHELTRAQWRRVADVDPSYCRGLDRPGRRPVEQVTWQQVVLAFEKLGLVLPTEAQWEYACRAGTSTPFSFGEDAAELWRYANVADRALLDRTGAAPRGHADWDDGFHWTAPVGSFEPNGFGLHDVHGNVREFCSDDYAVNLTALPRARTGDGGVANLPGFLNTVHRGGSWQYPPLASSTAHRARAGRFSARHGAGSDVGCRAALRLP